VGNRQPQSQPQQPSGPAIVTKCAFCSGTGRQPGILALRPCQSCGGAGARRI